MDFVIKVKGHSWSIAILPDVKNGILFPTILVYVDMLASFTVVIVELVVIVAAIPIALAVQTRKRNFV